MPEKEKDVLFAQNATSCDSKCEASRTKIYKMYAKTIDVVGSQRQLTNISFTFANIALFSIVSYFDQKWILGIALCYFWYNLVLSYQILNSAKFDVIVDILEKYLSFSPYTDEWKALQSKGNKKRYKILVFT